MSLRQFAYAAACAAAAVTPGLAAGPEPVAAPSEARTDVTPPDIVVTRKLDAARQQLQPSLGATRYDFSRQALETIPQGDNASLQSVLLQAPGVVTDSFGQVHVRDEHANVQYRLDGVQLPEGFTVFGQLLNARFAHSFSLITGALPAQYGFNHAGVVDIVTKSGTTDPGGELSLYGGSRGTFQPSVSYGGRSGAVDYYVTGEHLRTNIGIENPANTFNAEHDSSTQFRGLAHVSAILDDSTRISLLAGTFQADYQIPTVGNAQPLGFTVNGVGRADSLALQDHQRELAHFGILSLQKHFDDIDVQASAFTRYSSLYFSPDPVPDLLFTGIAQTAARSSWAQGLQTDASWRVSDTHTIRAGYQAQVERTVSQTTSDVLPLDDFGAQTSDRPISVRDGSGKTGTRYGGYIQDSWALFPAITVNYGARFDVVDEYTKDNAVSPRVNVVWTATPSTVVHAGYARTFTPPPFQSVGGVSVLGFLGTTAAPEGTTNDTPKAERADYFDVGLSQILAPGLTVGVDGFYKLSRNLIDEGQFGAPIVLTTYNYQSGIQEGLELSASYDRGPLSLYGNLSYARGLGRDITSAQFEFAAADLDYIRREYIHLDHDQRWTGSAGAAYTVLRRTDHPLRLSADLLVESGLRRGGDTPNGNAEPGYYVVNLSAVQRLRLIARGETELRLDVLNLLDRRYQIRDSSGVGVGAPQYGLRRAVLAGLTQRF